MIVVSNTSPIINLAAVGQLGLLRQLYSRVIIPQAVYHETVVVGAGQPGVIEVTTFDWIETRRATNEAAVASLQLELHEGGAEAIALTLELKADLLLLDERKARDIASRLGVKSIGLLAVLIEAKHAGLIPAARPIMDNLIEKAGFWIGHELYEKVLQVAGE